MVTINRRGEIQVSATRAIQKSMNRLIKCLYTNLQLWVLPSIVLVVVLICSFLKKVGMGNTNHHFVTSSDACMKVWNLKQSSNFEHFSFRQMIQQLDTSLKFTIWNFIVVKGKNDECLNQLSSRILL